MRKIFNAFAPLLLSAMLYDRRKEVERRTEVQSEESKEYYLAKAEEKRKRKAERRMREARTNEES